MTGYAYFIYSLRKFDLINGRKDLMWKKFKKKIGFRRFVDEIYHILIDFWWFLVL